MSSFALHFRLENMLIISSNFDSEPKTNKVATVRGSDDELF